MTSLIIANKITLTAFVIYRAERFLRTNRSGELSLLLIALSAWLSIAIARFNSLGEIDKWLRLILVLFLAVITFEPEMVFLFQAFVKKIKGDKTADEREMLDEVVRAATELAGTRTGALIAFERTDNLDKLSKTGIEINADVNKDLLTTLFFKDTATHDGCLLIRDGRITHCAVVLPLTSKVNVEEGLGTRHRAALGLTEMTDAICLVVSEEEGTISVAQSGKLNRAIPPAMLKKELLKAIGEKQEKSFYPLHYLRRLSVKEHTFDSIRCSKSYVLFLYEIAVTLFWFLMYVACNPGGFPKSLDLFFAKPWIYVPFSMFVLNACSVLVSNELFLNAMGVGFKKRRFLFIPVFYQYIPIKDIRHVIVKRETPGKNLWGLFLEEKKGKLISIDQGSSLRGLTETGGRIRELLQIELVNQT